MFVTVKSIFVDRIIPGVDGGTYDLHNCRVHCQSCSGRQGQRMTQSLVAQLKAFKEEQTRGRGVQFKTETLRAAVESAITESERQHNQWNNAQRAKFEAQQVEHAEQNNPLWDKALPKIRAAIRANRPITADIIPLARLDWSKEAAVFTEKPPKDATFVVPQDLRVLRNALRLITDETVTTTAMRALGVSASMIRTVCELAREDMVKQQATEKLPPAKPTTTRKRAVKTAVTNDVTILQG